MVQVERLFGYHDGVEDRAEADASNPFAGAAREFAGVVNASARQLAEATDRFISDYANHAAQAVERAERAAAAGDASASAARDAAQQARSTAEGLEQAVSRATERISNEVNQGIEAARVSLQRQFEEMQAQLQASVSRESDAASRAQAASAEARQAANEARQAADRAEQNAGSANAALTTAREAAETSRQAASLAEAGVTSSLGSNAHDLLERLEADYQLLTTLVQELHSRVSGMGAVSALTPSPTQAAAWSQATVAPESEALEQLHPVASGGSWNSQHAAPAEPEVVIPSGPPRMLSGRIQLSIKPVQDFDRLLNLDGALSRLAAVQTVALADYAQEEVTFRVELTTPVDAADFARNLGNAAGNRLEVTQADGDALSLHIL